MQPGNPGPDPYGQQPHDPYGQQPTSGQPAYGQPQYQDPYGQQPTSGQPAYGQPQYQDPYGQQPTSGQPYPGAGYGASGPQPQQNNLGLISMILGIASIPFVCICYLGVPLGIAAMVLGFLGKQKADQGLAANRGQAMAGLICGASALILTVLLVVLSVAFNLAAPTFTG